MQCPQYVLDNEKCARDFSAPYICYTPGSSDGSKWGCSPRVVPCPQGQELCDKRGYKCSTDGTCDQVNQKPDHSQEVFFTQEKCKSTIKRCKVTYNCEGGKCVSIPKSQGKGEYPTLGECKSNCENIDDQPHTCIMSKCNPDPGGEYPTLGECKANCENIDDQPHTCIMSKCNPDPGGEYPNLEACIKKCSDNGPRWCNRYNGTCEIPQPGFPSNFKTRTECEEKCAANSDIKFSCTDNGCVQDPNGMFRGTHAISDNGGNFIGYYSEECETNCKFGKNMKKSFFDRENSIINGTDCIHYPCSNEEIDNFKWIRGDYLLSFSDDSGAILCTPVKDVPDGVTAYDNPLDCHNAFGNAGFYCQGSGGYCKLNENKNFGSTLENCHESCANYSRTYTYNGKMCVEDPNSHQSLDTCVDNNATFDCSGPPYYTCNINKDGTGQYGAQQSYQCAQKCRPGH